MRLIVLILLLFSFGCVSTDHHTASYSPEKITKSDKILIAKIPGAYHYENFQQIKHTSAKNDLIIQYQPEEEWNLKALGISDPLDTQYFDLLKQNEYDYLLIFDNLIEEKGNSYSYYTDYELAQMNHPINAGYSADEADHQSSITLLLVSLESKKLVYKNDIQTNLGALVAKDKGSEHHVNVMTVEKVSATAIKKGFKKMLKDLYVD